LMPDRDGDHAYKIKSPLEEHERSSKRAFWSNPKAICRRKKSQRNVCGRDR
jgi:hypothetical protein